LHLVLVLVLFPVHPEPICIKPELLETFIRVGVTRSESAIKASPSLVTIL